MPHATTHSSHVGEKPTRVFCSYSHADAALRQKLEKHLKLLQRQKIIDDWHSRDVAAGEEWAPDLLMRLDRADIVLLLISSDFLASDHCWGVEMERALGRHRAGTAHVIPVILRPVDLTGAPFMHLQCLPRDGKAVVTWTIEDEAWTDIAQEIRRLATTLHRARSSTMSPAIRIIEPVSVPPPSNISPGEVNTAALRNAINSVLLGDDLDAFCQDYFPDIERRFTSGMQQVQKVTLLLKHADRRQILCRLIACRPESVPIYRKNSGSSSSE